MFQYHCLNPIAEKGLGLFDEEYKKSEDLQEVMTVGGLQILKGVGVILVFQT